MNTCCFYFKLRTGCLIIGYVNLIISIALLAIGIIIHVFSLMEAVNVATSEYKIRPKDISSNDMKLYSGFIAVILAIVLHLNLILSIVVLVGIHQKKKSLMKAYMVYYIIYLTFWAIFFMIIIFTTDLSIVCYTLVCLLIFAFNIYFCPVIRRYHWQMNDNPNEPQIDNTDELSQMI